MPVTSHEVIAFLLGVLAAGVLRALSGRPTGVDAAALARLERKLDQLLGQSGIAPGAMPAIQTLGPALTFPDVLTLMRQGKKIEAIKVYRQLTGVGLKEAKDAVEEMERRSP